jgi:hypothetical protein
MVLDFPWFKGCSDFFLKFIYRTPTVRKRLPMGFINSSLQLITFFSSYKDKFFSQAVE